MTRAITVIAICFVLLAPVFASPPAYVASDLRTPPVPVGDPHYYSLDDFEVEEGEHRAVYIMLAIQGDKTANAPVVSNVWLSKGGDREAATYIADSRSNTSVVNDTRAFTEAYLIKETQLADSTAIYSLQIKFDKTKPAPLRVGAAVVQLEDVPDDGGVESTHAARSGSASDDEIKNKFSEGAAVDENEMILDIAFVLSYTENTLFAQDFSHDDCETQERSQSAESWPADSQFGIGWFVNECEGPLERPELEWDSANDGLLSTTAIIVSGRE